MSKPKKFVAARIARIYRIQFIELALFVFVETWVNFNEKPDVTVQDGCRAFIKEYGLEDEICEIWAGNMYRFARQKFIENDGLRREHETRDAH